MAIVLREYQEQAKAAFYKHLQERDDNPCIVIPTAGGKTPLLASICSDAHRLWKGRVMILAHVKELLEQARDKLLTTDPTLPVGVYSAGLGKRERLQPITVAGIQSVHSKAHLFEPQDLIIVDECFVGETLIATPEGTRRIDTLCVGDCVRNADGVGVVQAVSCRIPNDPLFHVEFENGTSLTCTGSHPIFTNRGWQQARAVEGAFTFGIEDVRNLWESVCALAWATDGQQNPNGVCVSREEMAHKKMLLNILLQEIEQPDEQSSGTIENEGSFERNQTQAYQAWWQRPITSAFTACLATRFGGRMGVGSSRADGTTWRRERIPYLLQDRHCQSGKENRNRDRRQFSWSYREERPGREEIGFATNSRVVSVSRLEREGDAPVYNLRVSGHPSYFANGWLVHNCHRIPHNGEGMYRTFLQHAKTINPAVRLCGLTATPYRLDCGEICGPENLLNEVCFEVSVKELMRDGYLCRVKTRSGSAKVDLSGVHVRAGEFKADEMSDAFNQEGLVYKSCQEIVNLTDGRQGVLVFCCSVAHGENVTSVLKLLTNDRVDFVCGETPPDERRQIIADFKAKRIRFLVNVNVLTEGFDATHIDCVALLRATLSPGLYYQMVGRGFRLHDGKDDCLVLDFGTNIERHGPVDLIRRGRKPGDGPAPQKECPSCNLMIPAACRECPECGMVQTEMPEERKPSHGTTASDAPIISGQATVERYPVKSVRYNLHIKKGTQPGEAPPTLRVDYELAFNQWKSEWVCIEHEGYAQAKARLWWNQRTTLPMPGTVAEALEIAYAGGLATPASITVRETAGDRFGRITHSEITEKFVAGDDWALPEKEKDDDWSEPVYEAPAAKTAYDDNEIPF